MAASFEEKSVWVQCIAMTIGLGLYFAIAGLMMAQGITRLPAYVPLFAVSVVLMVAILVAGHIVAAVTGRAESRDERDRLIGWKAEARSGWLLATGVLAAITGMVFEFEPVWTAHMLLASMFLSELLGFVLRIVSYRRGV